METRAELIERISDLNFKLVALKKAITRGGTSFKREIAGTKAAIHVAEKQLKKLERE